MVGELILLPVRVGVRATQLWMRVAGPSDRSSAAAELDAQERTGDGPVRSASRREKESPDHTVIPRGDRAPRPPTERSATSAAWAAPTESEPPHVSEEPTLVEELAEPGAEHGAGAEIHIEEPWDGYAQMTAKQVISRLAGATPAEVAAVQLYETSHRRRQTVLNVVQRELRSANGSSPPSQQKG